MKFYAFECLYLKRNDTQWNFDFLKYDLGENLIFNNRIN